MVTLREFWTPGRFITRLGAIKFPGSQFKDQTKTPHYEMDKAIDFYMNRPMINSGIKQLARFIVGSEINIKSADPKTHKFLNDWVDMRNSLDNEIFHFCISAIVTGNAYFENAWKKMPNGQFVLDNVYNINDVARVYINMDYRGNDDDFWLYEVPIEVRVFPFMGELKTPKFFRINYVYGSYLFQKQIWAIPVHKSKIKHFKIGWSRDGLYGRGFLASCIDDTEILVEILKNYSIIARFRALGRKIVSIGAPDNPASPDDIDKLEADLKGLEDKDNIIINKPFKTEPLSYTGENDPMDAQIEFLRKEISSGLVPNYLTPWNSEVNRATADEVKIPFALEMDSFRADLIQYLNENIIGELRKAYTWLAKDATFTFGIVDLEAKSDKIQRGLQLYQSNAITLNELRKMSGLETFEGGDKFSSQMAAPTASPQLPPGPIESLPVGPMPAGTESFVEFYNGMKMPQGWSKINEMKFKHIGFGITMEIGQERGKDYKNKEATIYLVKNNGRTLGKFFDFDEAMTDMWFFMSQTSRGIMTTSESFKEQMDTGIDTSDDAWLKRMKAKGIIKKGETYTVKKKFNVNGKVLRLVEHEGMGYHIYDGTTETKFFDLDEYAVAKTYFIRLREKRLEDLDKFFDQELPEHKLMDDFFEQVKRLNVEIIDDAFNEITKGSIVTESITFKEQRVVGRDVVGAMERTFSRFNDRIGGIVSNITSRLFGLAVRPEVKVGVDPEANEAAQAEMRKVADILRDRMNVQLRTMNDQMKADMVRTVSNAVAENRPISQVRQELKDKYSSRRVAENPQDWQIDRVVKTELSNAVSLMKLQKWRTMGFDRVEHLTTEDEKVCEKCRPLNRRPFSIDTLLTSPDRRVPLHPHCRCIYAVYD